MKATCEIYLKIYISIIINKEHIIKAGSADLANMYSKLFNGKIAKVKQVLQLSNFFIFPHHPWEIFGSARMILCNNYCTSLFILNNVEKKTVFNNGLVISVASKKMLASSLPGRMIIVNTSNHISRFLISKQNKWRLCWFGQGITT